MRLNYQQSPALPSAPFKRLNSLSKVSIGPLKQGDWHFSPDISKEPTVQTKPKDYKHIKLPELQTEETLNLLTC